MITIPRLELTAAVVSVTVSNMLSQGLGHANIKEYFWTDSKVVLEYINNDAQHFHTGSRRYAKAQVLGNGFTFPQKRIQQTVHPEGRL